MERSTERASVHATTAYPMKTFTHFPQVAFTTSTIKAMAHMGLVLLAGACGTDEHPQASRSSDPPRAIAPELVTRDTAAAEKAAASFPSARQHADNALTYRIIEAPGGTYGYDILSDGNLFIHQTNLPGRPGIEGCRTREQAETLAKLVIKKVEAGEMPPTVTAEELTALNLN